MKKKKKKENAQSFRDIIENNLLMLKYIYKYSKTFLYSFLIISITYNTFFTFVNVWLIKNVVDTIQIGESIDKILINIIVLLIIGAFVIAYHQMFWQRFSPPMTKKIQLNMQRELFSKAIETDLECYDNTEYFNEFIMAASNANTKATDVIGTLSLMFENIAKTAILSASIIILDPIGIVFAIVAFIITFYGNMISNKIRFKMYEESQPAIRKREYTKRVFYLADYAKELRLGNMKGKLIQSFKEANNEQKKLNYKYSIKLIIMSLIAFSVTGTLIFSGFYPITLLFKVSLSGMTYGSFAAILYATVALRDNLSGLVEIFPKFAEHSLYIAKFKGFLNFDNKIKTGSANIPKSIKDIKIKNLSFRYNKESPLVLDNINLTIKANQKIAFVGYNGAGKSTLVNLIMRLYDPINGEILYDGKNIKEYKTLEYRNQFGTVFQDFTLFSTTLAENVVMDEVCEENKNSVLTALEKSGFANKIDSLKDGIDTPVYKEFYEDGVYFSQGEEQKIAIARSLYKNSPIIIMDEPSSALDPIAEYELNNTIINDSKNKTVIFISHRLSTTKSADCIYMLEQGKIIERGTHEDLMQLNGKYAEMFNMQSENYKTGVNV